MRRRIVGSLVVGFGIAVGVSACTFSAHASLTDDVNDFNKQVAKAVSKEVSQTVSADCGDDDIDLIDGNVVHCRIWTGSGSEPAQVQEATATLSNVHGTKFDFNITSSGDMIDSGAELPQQSK